ncbi:MAG: protein arginine kinase [Eubacteriales bacterium]|nr:protein arginine kinase [Eubacteriales bacterium]
MKWYEQQGKQGDVVISSRIRLARNLKDFPFASKMSQSQAKEVLQKVKAAAKPLGLTYLSMEAMPPVNRQMLMERHIISPEMLGAVDTKAVLISEDEKISVMVNEEDHLRIQSMMPGLGLQEALKSANHVDDVLEKSLDYGFHPQYGYTTCCPTNTGTGLRASCMLHLPALTANGFIHTLLASVGKLGFTIRGVYGEGTKALGNLYQISNQITLGISEEETIKRLVELVLMVGDKERKMRQNILAEQKSRITDMVMRSLGTLKNAYILSSDEAFKLISDVRLGINMGIIKDVDITDINRLSYEVGAAHIASLCGEDGESAEKRDIMRAKLAREKLSLKG